MIHSAIHAANMLSGVLLFNQKGELLIMRSFRQDMRPRLADVFRIQVISNAQIRSPIVRELHLRCNNNNHAKQTMSAHDSTASSAMSRAQHGQQ